MFSGANAASAVPARSSPLRTGTMLRSAVSRSVARICADAGERLDGAHQGDGPGDDGAAALVPEKAA